MIIAMNTHPIINDNLLNNKWDKDKEFEQYIKFDLDQFNDNIKRTKEVTDHIISEIRQNGFSPVSVYAKVNGHNNFSIFVFVPEEDFFDENILKIYVLKSEMEKQYSDNNYTVKIGICNQSDKESFNKERSLFRSLIMKYNGYGFVKDPVANNWSALIPEGISFMYSDKHEYVYKCTAYDQDIFS